jgi:hypothetical protein
LPLLGGEELLWRSLGRWIPKISQIGARNDELFGRNLPKSQIYQCVEFEGKILVETT